ncbi:MAG: adenylate kinase [Candidatus Omnitrophica bacterium]|nr:adenylate kinase [Candidatus Omnitrophota bacterium]
MRLVLLGPPGAGKGTQAVVLSKNYKALHVSTGDMLRDALKKKTKSGILAKDYMERGELVPDEIVTKIVSERISKADAKQGFILDGFPRNKNQAVDLDRELKNLEISLDMVLYFKTSELTSVERLTGRRVCPKCGINYHVKNRPPKNNNLCDTCNVILVHRNDDKVETIKKRLEVYDRETKPLLDYYSESGLLREVSGNLDVDGLFRILQNLFKKENVA